MPSISSDARFLGVDLSQLWQEIKRPWLRAHEWPLLAWLTPRAPLHVLQSDGGQSLWLANVSPIVRKGEPGAKFFAVELSEALVLARKLAVPVMRESDTVKAIELTVRGVSPFPMHEVVWGYRIQSSTSSAHEVEIALASRKQVDEYLAEQAPRLPAGTSPEVWALCGRSAPIVLRGYGEALRAAYAARWRRIGYGLLVSLSILLAAVAVTPIAQLRLRALEAVEAFGAAGNRAVPVVRQRELLLHSLEQGGNLAELLADRIDPLKVLDRLTKILPDDTALQSFKLQGTKVSISGVTSNAAALIQLLGDEKGWREVRAPAGATRMPGATKESFAIEFTADPRVFGVGVGGELAAAPRDGAGGRLAGSAVAGVAPAQTQTTRAASSLSPVASQAGGAVFGGGATFGGAAARPAAVPTTPKP